MSERTDERVIYQFLSGPDLELLDPIMRRRGWTTLNYPTSCAWGAFDDGKLIGFIVLQLFPHPEPLYVEPEYRSTGVAEGLADHMLAFMREINIRGYMVVADSEFAVKLCEDRGMERVQSPVFIMRKEMVQ